MRTITMEASGTSAATVGRCPSPNQIARMLAVQINALGGDPKYEEDPPVNEGFQVLSVSRET